MANCSKCGAPHERPGRYCKKCHAAYMRHWRERRVSITVELSDALLTKALREYRKAYCRVRFRWCKRHDEMQYRDVLNGSQAHAAGLAAMREALLGVARET